MSGRVSSPGWKEGGEEEGWREGGEEEGWRWVGEGYRRPGGKGKKKLFFKSIQVNYRVYTSKLQGVSR